MGTYIIQETKAKEKKVAFVINKLKNWARKRKGIEIISYLTSDKQNNFIWQWNILIGVLAIRIFRRIFNNILDQLFYLSTISKTESKWRTLMRKLVQMLKDSKSEIQKSLVKVIHDSIIQRTQYYVWTLKRIFWPKLPPCEHYYYLFFLYMDNPKGKNFEINMSFKEVLRSIALKIIMEWFTTPTQHHMERRNIPVTNPS